MAQSVLDDLLGRGIYVQAYVDDTLWAPRDCEEVRFYSRFSRVPYEVKTEAIRHLPQAPHKLLVISDQVRTCGRNWKRSIEGRSKSSAPPKGSWK